MLPELFRIGSLSISPFGVTMVLAFLGGYFQLRWGLRRLGAGGEDDASALVMAAGFGGIVGAKMYYALLVGDWRVLFARSGLVWYGGFLLAVAAILWVIHRRRPAPWPVADAATPGLALGYAIGRVGCFLVGDDYGRPTDLPWGIAFPQGIPPSTAGNLRHQFGVHLPDSIADSELLRVHPTQLYETVTALAIWGVGIYLLRRGVRTGTVTAVTLGLLACERFTVELLRAKDDRFLGPFTVAQAISVVVLLAVLSLWWWRRPEPAPRRKKR